MTLLEARAEARRRWGDAAGAVREDSGWAVARGKYRVGVWVAGFMALGYGPTWEAAFADADMRNGNAPVADRNGAQSGPERT